MGELDELRTYWDGLVEREASRDQTDPRKRVHTDLLWRLLRRHLPPPPARVLDAGAGTGRFSLPLARQGYAVVHLDLSPAMLRWAEGRAREEGLHLEFVEGSVTDLGKFPERSFDVVLSLDSPISFCADRYREALDEVARVCRDVLVVCVMNRLGVIAEGGMNFDLEHFGMPRTVVEVWATGDLRVTRELRKLQPSLMPSWHAFTAEELRRELGVRGFRVLEVVAVGTLARFIRPDLLAKAIGGPEAYSTFLDFAEAFDREPGVLGVGAAGAGGLAAAARRVDGQVRPGYG